MSIGKRIRTARKAAGLSQEELARRAGMSLKGMGDIERGDIADPHYSSLSKIAGGLGVSVGELLEEPVTAGKGEASATGLVATERPVKLPPSSPELPEKSEHRPWQRMSEEQKEARRYDYDWGMLLNGAYDRLREEKEKNRKADWRTYPNSNPCLRETYALLNRYKSGGGARGSERLEKLEALIRTVIGDINRINLHKDDPRSSEQDRQYGMFGEPSPEDRAFSQDAADVYQVDEANQDAR